MHGTELNMAELRLVAFYVSASQNVVRDLGRQALDAWVWGRNLWQGLEKPIDVEAELNRRGMGATSADVHATAGESTMPQHIGRKRLAEHVHEFILSYVGEDENYKISDLEEHLKGLFAEEDALRLLRSKGYICHKKTNP